MPNNIDIWHINIEYSHRCAFISGSECSSSNQNLQSELVMHWNENSWNQKLWTQLAKKKSQFGNTLVKGPILTINYLLIIMPVMNILAVY